MMTMRFKDKIVGDQLPISEVADVLVWLSFAFPIPLSLLDSSYFQLSRNQRKLLINNEKEVYFDRCNIIFNNSTYPSITFILL